MRVALAHDELLKVLKKHKYRWGFWYANTVVVDGEFAVINRPHVDYNSFSYYFDFRIFLA